MSLRLACVSYMNAHPLWRCLPQLPQFAPPATLYQWMLSGKCDVALLPSAALLWHRDWQVISQTCIASDGPVQSVKLFHRLPIVDCRRIGLDSESLTSNLLLKLLLKNKYSINIENIEFIYLNKSNTLDNVDAFLQIGDKALSAHYPGWEAWDLGEAWQRFAEKPFVYALWLAKKTEETEALAAQLDQAYQDAWLSRKVWISEMARKQQLSVDCLTDYFENALQFQLTPAAQSGLTTFLTLARDCNLHPS